MITNSLHFQYIQSLYIAIPRSGDALQRGEGVAIVLDPVLSVAWRDVGEV